MPRDVDAGGESLRGRHRECGANLVAVDAVVGRTQHEVRLVSAGAQDADEGFDPGAVGAPLPTGDDGLRGADRGGQRDLRQAGGPTGGPDQLAEIRPGERIPNRWSCGHS